MPISNEPKLDLPPFLWCFPGEELENENRLEEGLESDRKKILSPPSLSKLSLSLCGSPPEKEEDDVRLRRSRYKLLEDLYEDAKDLEEAKEEEEDEEEEDTVS